MHFRVWAPVALPMFRDLSPALAKLASVVHTGCAGSHRMATR